MLAKTAAGGGNGNPLKYSCQDDSVDRAACWATVHGVTNSWTRLKQLSMRAPTACLLCL